MSEDYRRYLVVVRCDPADRAAAAKWTMDVIGGLAIDSRLAFTSEKGETFGVWLKANKAAAQIRSALEREYTKADRAFVLVVEIGNDWSGIGNSRGWEWLQHH